uniref:Family with sequence similarity 110 member A n=1 Tax=Neogobius melanostomus TaxID=47308 RepID=A0A8C6SKU4_9GOBI
MPVETLRAPFCPSDGRLFRLKAPEYLQSAPSRRLSAVERLEADKVKYVKSQQVALTRQAPVIRKALLPPALACSAPGRIQTCYKPSAHSSSPRRSLRSTENEPKPPVLRPLTRPLTRPQTRPPPVPLRPAHAAAVRRVDVRPSEVRTPQRRPLQLAPPSAPPTLSSPPALPPRSSDLSERLSRAAADLQRFFNFCGLDPDEVQALGSERFTPRANSDIVSGRRSVSSASEGEELTERAELAEDGEEQVSERTPYGISVIERNARVIKWLYGLRQATGGKASYLFTFNSFITNCV